MCSSDLQGKTETEDFDANKIFETYGIIPEQLIEVKGLMGDASDNIPGVPGIGEKTALNLIQKYKNIDQLYEAIENGDTQIKGKQKEKLLENKELAYLSRTLGTIDKKAPIEKDLATFQVQDWNKPAVLELFRELRFKRFIERFQLESEENEPTKKLEDLFIYIPTNQPQSILDKIYEQKEIYYYFELIEDPDAFIIKKKIETINLYLKSEKKVYCVPFDNEIFKPIFENNEILKCGYEIKEDFILLKQAGLNPQNMMFDAKIAMYLLNSGSNLYSLEEIAKQQLNLEIEDYYQQEPKEDIQTSFFDQEIQEEKTDYKYAMYCYIIGETKLILEQKLKEVKQLDLFRNIEMPSAEILAQMRYTGVLVDKDDIEKMSQELKKQIQGLSHEIYELAGQEFNINSPKQLGEILFEKLELPYKKKNKNGYSTRSEERRVGKECGS